MSKAKKFQAWINQIKSYQKKAPELFNENVKKSDSEFKIDHYFDILDNLELEPGWLVDYLYLQQRLGGEPLIIAFPESKKTEYQKIINKINDNTLDSSPQDNDSENIIETFLNYDDVDNYLDHLILDGSEESYFQFVILAKLGTQFALFWHALYNDGEFICTPEAAEKIIKRIGLEAEDISSIDNQLFDQQTIEEVKKINFEPQINIKEDKAVVKLVFFTKWGGFIRAKYIAKTTFPHKIIEKETENLVEYSCDYNY